MIPTIFRYEFARHVTRRAYVIMTVIVPLLVVSGFIAYQLISESGNDSPDTSSNAFEDIQPIGLVDESGVFSNIPPGIFAEKILPYESNDAALDAVEAGTIDIYYLVEADYLDTGDIQRRTDQFSLATDDLELLSAFVLNQLLASEEDATIYLRLQDPVNLTINEIDTGSGDVESRNEGVDFTRVYIFAMPFLFTVFTASRYLMQSVVEERENRMVEILLSSVKPMPLLIGKILAMGTLGLIQMVAWLATIAWVLRQLQLLDAFGVDFEQPIDVFIITLLYFLGGYLLFGSLFAGVGAISNSMREGPQLVTVFTLPAVLPLWITFIFATDPNGTLPVVMSMFPLTAPLAMIMRSSVTTVPLWQVVLSLALLFLATLGAMWMAGRLFRIKTLLSGSRPKLRDLPGLLFHA
ncbi:MAG: ABC transporter permease [Chloroflexi bacterium]|nr:ABC transporter permease [Chloroflexota bacterium]